MSVGKMFRTQGTDLYFVSSTGDVLRLNCITEAPDPVGGDRPDIDITCLESLAREFVSGLETPSDGTFPFILDADSDAHTELFALKDSGENTQWYLGMSDDDTDPTLDIDDNLEHPEERSGFIFTASVRNLELAGPLDEVWRGTVTLRRSGTTDRQILPTPE